jgi:hypothetical protein
MMHVMNPGVQESNTIRGPRSQSVPLVSEWAQQHHRQAQLADQSVAHLGYATSHQFNSLQEYQIPLNDDPPKRERSHAAAQHPNGHPQSPAEDTALQQGSKRSRRNTYRAPREVKPTVTSVLGSLVGGSSHENNATVKMRRQLSGSQLDQFMSSGDDKMDEDPVPIRERAMSF